MGRALLWRVAIPEQILHLRGGALLQALLWRASRGSLPPFPRQDLSGVMCQTLLWRVLVLPKPPDLLEAIYS